MIKEYFKIFHELLYKGKMEQIINYCITKQKFTGLTEPEIYDWLCKNFSVRDYPMMRLYSFEIWRKVNS